MYKVYILREIGLSEIRYVGITKRSLQQRLKEHIKDKDFCHRSNWIRSVNGNIEICEIESNIPNIDIANEREIYYISYYRSLGARLVNSTNGGDGLRGYKCSEATKQKLRIKNIGKKLTEEHRIKMSISRTGKKRTDEFKVKMSLLKRGENNPFYGVVGRDHPKSKPVAQYDLSMNKIVEFDSIREAILKTGTLKIGECCRVANKNRKSYKNLTNKKRGG